MCMTEDQTNIFTDHYSFMRGVAYQQELNSNTSATSTTQYIDALSDGKSCKRDIEVLKKVRTNTIRVYAVDPTKNHDDCMNALADAGIYVVADLSEPGLYVYPSPPMPWHTVCSWQCRTASFT
jgi:hypothetical protein